MKKSSKRENMETLINIYNHLMVKQIAFVLKLGRQSPFLARVSFRIFKVLHLVCWPIEKIAVQKWAQLKHDPNRVREEFFAALAYLFERATEEQYERLIEKFRREGAAKILSGMKWIFDERIVNEGEVLQFFVTRRLILGQPVYECDDCHTRFAAPPGWAGQNIKCPGPRCGREYTKEELETIAKNF